MNVFASHMSKYNYAKSQNIYKFFIGNLININKHLPKN